MKKIIMVESQEFNSKVKIGAHHYAQLFAKAGYQVLWLSPAYSMLHYVSDYETTKQRKNLNKEKFIEFEPNIFGYSPFTLIPFGKQSIINSEYVAKKYLKTSFPRSIKQILKKNGFDNVDYLWISNLKSFYIKDLINYKYLIHRIADEKSGLPGHFKTLELLEDKLIKESDIVFATSQYLVNKVEKIRNDVKYLPNGVRFNDFNKTDYKMPIEYSDNKRKKCIYVGAIAQWLDNDLITYLLKEMPNIDFYFIGPNHGGVIEKLNEYNNFKYLGRKPYKEIADYLYYSDVAIIPFLVNKLTDAINPVKLFEYLSVGVPTVSTDFMEIRHIDGPFEVAISKEDFKNKIEKSLTMNNSNKLIQFAKENDWEERFKVILNELDVIERI